MSSIVPSAYVALPTLGKLKETSQYERQKTRVKSHNSEPARHLAKHLTHAYT